MREKIDAFAFEKPQLQASSSPIPRIRKWPISDEDVVRSARYYMDQGNH